MAKAKSKVKEKDPTKPFPEPPVDMKKGKKGENPKKMAKVMMAIMDMKNSKKGKPAKGKGEKIKKGTGGIGKGCY